MTLLPRKAPKMFGAKNVGDKGKILLPEGRDPRTGKYLGSGRFSTAFLTNAIHRPVIIYTFHEDFSKSILSHTKAENSTNRHLPDIKRIGRYVHRGTPCNVYESRYYECLEDKSVSPEMRDLVDLLQDLHDEACSQFPGNIIRSRESDDFNKFICEGQGIPLGLKKALNALRFIAQDWGDHYLFDSFKDKNLGRDMRGNLILLDPMFDMLKMQRHHETKSRKATAQARAIHSIDNDFS